MRAADDNGYSWNRGRHPPPARRRPTTRSSRSPNSSTLLVSLARQSGGRSTSPTVSAPFGFERRPSDTTSRSTRTASRRTTRSSRFLSQSSTRRSEHSSTASTQRSPTPTISTISVGSSSLKASSAGRPTDGATSIASWSSMATERQPAGRLPTWSPISSPNASTVTASC